MSVAQHVAYSLGTGRLWVRGSAVLPLLWGGHCSALSLGSASMLVLGFKDSTQNRVIAKDVKSCNYCCYVRCATLIVLEGEMPWPQTSATQYHAQLGLQDKGHAIKGI